MQAYHDEEWGVPQRDPRALWKCSCSKVFRPGCRGRSSFASAQHFDRHSKASIPMLSPGSPAGTSNDSWEPGHHPGARQDRSDHCRRPSVPRDARPRRTLWRVTAVLHRRESSEGRRTVGSGPNRALRKDFQGPETTGLQVRGRHDRYAWMQAVGIVNDHSLQCFRRDQVGRGQTQA